MSCRMKHILIAGIAAGFGCADATAPLGEHQLQVRVRVTGSAAAAPGAVLAPGITALEIEQAVLVLGGLKLETAGLDQTVDWTLLESVVLPLDLGGGPTLAFDAEVPAGTYKELEISIDKLEVGHPGEQLLIDAWPALADASVLVTGTVVRNGTPEAFTFTAALDIDLELDFPAPVAFTEDAAATLIEMTLDLSQWFRSQSGATLDPNDAGDRSEIEASISRSIEVATQP